MSPIFGLVLSQVPVDLAGVGSGVMSTAQQVALATGATAIGTLFLSLQQRRRPGPGRPDGGAAHPGGRGDGRHRPEPPAPPARPRLTPAPLPAPSKSIMQDLWHAHRVRIDFEGVGGLGDAALVQLGHGGFERRRGAGCDANARRSSSTGRCCAGSRAAPTTKRSGSVWNGKWPAPSKISSRLPGIASWASRACRTGTTGSRSPQTSRVGMPAAR